MNTHSASIWIETITSEVDSVRNRTLEELCGNLDAHGLLDAAYELDRFRRSASNLYHRVRAHFFLAALYRYYLPPSFPESSAGLLPYEAYQHILGRRFPEAIDQLLAVQRHQGPTVAIASALSRAYHQLGIQTLADQVKRSVRTVRGNQWMFRIGHPNEHPLRLNQSLLRSHTNQGDFPILTEKTSVRMDFSHSGWSDIFFLGMDFPEGAKVLNASIHLGVYGRDSQPQPPVEAYLRVIDRPVLRLVSTDLGAEAEITEIDEVFDFAKDYLGLLKGALIASGVVPPAMEGCHRKMSELLATLIGKEGLGLELVSRVNNIPKGSRLAVSTNLLGCLISVLMRATQQVGRLTGELEVVDQRLITARAILGEWLGGSGGGWQDSGGIWPGIKRIEGVLAQEGDPEFGISRGRLLPRHTVLDAKRIPRESLDALQKSLILVYGGMAQNVGPILEMVTEKYLVRASQEWRARNEAIGIYEQIVTALETGDIRRVANLTTKNFTEPLQTIIPWCTNRFTDRMIEQCRERWGEQFWGFLMLGGMSGGGMGFFFDPSVQDAARPWLLRSLVETKQAMETQLPFAMDPIVYEFSIQEKGSWAKLLSGDEAMMPDGYYSIVAPKWIRREIRDLTPQVQRELGRLNHLCRMESEKAKWLLDRIMPQQNQRGESAAELRERLQYHGFDREVHEQIRTDLLGGRIGLSENRLPPQSIIEDVSRDDIIDLRDIPVAPAALIRSGEGSVGAKAILENQVAVVTLAAGVGSRWTGGAGVVKGLHPFCRLAGQHRSFIEVHLAKSRQTSRRFGANIPHVFTTGYLTHGPIERHLSDVKNYRYPGPVHLSRGLSVGLRMVPTVRDLQFLWQEMAHQTLDEQQQKVRESAHAAIIGWAQTAGEASDYTDNIPEQCMHPVGHWYEIPNMLRNGLLHRMLVEQPSLQYLLLHNIDTLGANIDPLVLSKHIESNACLSFEVISRRVDDRGGGLALVDGKRRLVEGMAMPSDQDEFKLSFYSSMTTWISIDRLLQAFELKRSDLGNSDQVEEAVRAFGQRLPTYITIKDVKKRWGLGQEDVFPVSQFEKIWGDMSSLPSIACEYIAVPAVRGQQLKDPGQLDGWVRDGSADTIERMCDFS
ncbi:UTP--glucose-1-phosphate uridylyltransferase [Pirellula sp. SH-Sr6A]|uniref:UTP--glucose-1-phosphate uridylyltransferase n=1 Tax=Pirellula sp. SH-Sr6A TaxID=1632865 RepID=UPI00078C191E|nr:UTP--glucose-1-phosphate uridylyltransferase [Pirellula sp. SH-Sr6A]AMV34396.1 UTP--glucose-1-phosphate uridylyltransferase [Pirellula sp. SH-Sr6A]